MFVRSVEVAAAWVLARVESRGIPVRGAVEDLVQRWPEFRRVRAVVTALSLDTLRRYRLLDALLAHVGLRPRRVFDRNLLRVLLFEARFRGRDDRLGGFEKLLTAWGYDPSALRRAVETPVEEVLGGLSEVARLAVLYSFPEWVVRAVLRVLPLGEVVQFLEALNSPQPMYLRVNTSRVSRDELLGRLREAGVKAEPDEDLPDVIRVWGVGELERLPGYSEGLFYIQDKASALVGHVAALTGASEVVDACSAPGGKAMHVSELMRCRVVAIDSSPHRLATEARLVARYGYDGIDLVLADSRRIPVKLGRRLVVVDPDCSSIGKMGHSPELRLFIKPQMVPRLARLQRRLLEEALAVVGKGGYVLYSTCTVTLEENEEVVKRVLDRAELVDLADRFPRFANPLMPGTLRVWPHRHGANGYFIALLRRR